MAAYERQVRAVQRQAKFEHWQELNRQMLSLAFVHREEFPDVVAPVAPEPERVDEDAVYGRHERDELALISFWRCSLRREAKAVARDAASAEIAEERAKREQERVRCSGGLTTSGSGLCGTITRWFWRRSNPPSKTTRCRRAD
jgi:hypothetical protein